MGSGLLRSRDVRFGTPLSEEGREGFPFPSWKQLRTNINNILKNLTVVG